MPIGTYLHGYPADLRGVLMLALSEAGTVLNAAHTTDAGGGATQTWTAGAAVACRIDPLGSGDGPTAGGKLDERSTHVVTVPPGTVISPANRFGIAGRGTFEVTAVRLQTDEMATMFEVIYV